MINTYNSPKLTLAEDEVFVFGANLQSFHAGGAAGWATSLDPNYNWRLAEYDKLPDGTKGKWNEKGKLGPQVGTEGKSYAIPTVTRAGAKRSIPLAEIKKSIEKFYAFAKSRPNLKFFVAQENKAGLNGYLPTELAEIYSGEIPENVYFDEGFANLLNKESQNVAQNSKSQPNEEIKINSHQKELHRNRCIIAGSRSITDYFLICAAVKESGFQIDEVVSGNAKGVDSLGEKYALHNNIPLKQFPAPWNETEGKPQNEIGQTNYGKKFWKLAGPFRNRQMADYATHLILCWDGKSSGSANMLKLAEEKNLTIFQKLVN
jgi:hypothetical protein